ncbi:glycosyltransferase family 2 protein [Halococcoides cellulosivorans]|uniref:Glycosyltransferase 2-like domain-containing protein n=1 Tax=Halococcoides cellulosivorans TaxID=1679096 RepID=A0A2R4WXZ1_9EURY|nr:hypothetical protein HARCEL1_01050 [Halococcoides cellulosivorans]
MSAVSVIIPTLDEADYIEESLDATLAQTVSDIEVIVVDGGSTDGTCEIVADHPDDRIILQENGDIVDSLNVGLEKASGRFVARVDADAVPDPTRFERQIELLERNPSVGLVGCFLRKKDPDTGATTLQREPVESAAIRRRLPLHNPIPHSTWMVRREVYETVGRYRSYRWEDYELLSRVIQQYEVRNLDAALVTEYDRPDSIIETTPTWRAILASAVCGLLVTARGSFSFIDRILFGLRIGVLAGRRFARIPVHTLSGLVPR